MSHPSLNPHAEAYADIEDVQREIQSISVRLEFLQRYHEEFAELVKQRAAAEKRLAKLEAEHAKRVKKGK